MFYFSLMMVCISMMRMIMRRLICSPICHFYTFTHQFMVEPELFYPEVGSHDLVPQILNSFTMSNIIKEHSLQAQSIIIWKDVKYQYMRSNTSRIPTHPLTTSIKWHRFINSISISINIDIQRLALSRKYLLTTSMSWDNFSLNFTVTGSVTFLTGRT